jgi:hypothetical protein
MSISNSLPNPENLSASTLLLLNGKFILTAKITITLVNITE